MVQKVVIMFMGSVWGVLALFFGDVIRAIEARNFSGLWRGAMNSWEGLAIGGGLFVILFIVAFRMDNKSKRKEDDKWDRRDWIWEAIAVKMGVNLNDYHKQSK